MRHAFLLAILILIMVFPAMGSGPYPPAGEYEVPLVTGKIKPDGLLDEAVWEKALKISLDYEVQPGENIKPPVRTEVLLAYTKTHLYVAFKAYDPNPSEIRARISDRDRIWADDWVGVILDTFNDQRRSYDFLCNPFGVQNDFVETPTGGGNEWDTIWSSGGRINEEGYFVEMSIPFSSLRFQRSEGAQVWGFDAVRSYPRSVRHHIGTFPRDRNNNCYLCQAIKLKGFTGAKPGKNLEFDPTLSAHVSSEREDGGVEGPFVHDKKTEPGITARWGFTPNLTLSATVNPDFSQVEADDLQMDINEPFALFFSEKRPFFVEGSDFFRTRMRAIYTRMMRDPSWGVKLTGKEGANTIGAYMVRDTLTNLVFPGSEGSNATSLAMESTATVLRYRRDFGKKYTVGVLFTNREGDDYFNRVAGFDADLRFTNKDKLQLQVLGSSTRYPGEVVSEYDQRAGRFNDRALDVLYIHDTRNLDIYAAYRDIGRDFRADLGFMPQAGFRSLEVGSNYRWYAPPDSWWTRFTLDGEFRQDKDQDGRLLSRKATGTFTYEGPMNTHALLQYTREREGYNGALFDQNRFFIHNCMNLNRHSHIHTNVFFGDRVDYANTRLGRRFRISPGIEYHIGLRLKASLSHTYERMWAASQRLYTANQSELHLVYQFSKRSFLRTVLQYVDYRYNTANYIDEVDPVYKHLFTQVLFSYKLNPQTVLFLGYSDNYYGYLGKGMPQANRKFFLKIGYALIM